MSKRKIDSLGGITSSKDSKKVKRDFSKSKEQERVPNLLIDSDSQSSSEDESDFGGTSLEEQSFKINEEYARRFEHNKKREELHRCMSQGFSLRCTPTNFNSGGEVPKGAKTF
jgi:protein KRI1